MKHISEPLHNIMTRLILQGNCPDEVLHGTKYEYLIALREFPRKSQTQNVEQALYFQYSPIKLCLQIHLGGGNINSEPERCGNIDQALTTRLR